METVIEAPAAPPSLYTIARVFGWISATSFGGGQMASIRREVVRRHKWLSDDEFLAMLSIAQILPGANPTNLSVLIGSKLRGWLGASVALAMNVLPGFVILMAIAAVALNSHQPMLVGALKGCAAVAVGLTFANAVELTMPKLKSAVDVVLIVAVACGAIFLHVPLVVSLLIFVPIAFALTWRETK